MSLNILKNYIKMISEGSASTDLSPNKLNAGYMSKIFGKNRSKSNIDQYNFKLLAEINEKLENFDYDEMHNNYNIDKEDINYKKNLAIYYAILGKLLNNSLLKNIFIKKNFTNDQYIYIPENAIYTTADYTNISKGEIILKKIDEEDENYDEENLIINELNKLLNILMSVYDFSVHDTENIKFDIDEKYFNISEFVSAKPNANQTKKQIYEQQTGADYNAQVNFAQFLLNISGSDIFISFVDPYEKNKNGTFKVPLLGINPNATFGTPHGIYAYPFDKHNALSYIATGTATHAKFARKREYFHLIRVDLNHPNVLNIDESGNSKIGSRKYDKNDYQKDFNELVRMANILFNFPLSRNFSGNILDLENNITDLKYSHTKTSISHMYTGVTNNLRYLFKKVATELNIDAQLTDKKINEIINDIANSCGLTDYVMKNYVNKIIGNNIDKNNFDKNAEEQFYDFVEEFKNITVEELPSKSSIYRNFVKNYPQFNNLMKKHYDNYMQENLPERYSELVPDSTNSINIKDFMTNNDVLNAKFQYKKHDPLGNISTNSNAELADRILSNIVIIKDELNKIKDFGVRIWKAAFFISRIFSYNQKNQNFNITRLMHDAKSNSFISSHEGRSEFFSLLLNSIGIKCVIDQGSGTVHGNEPSQMHIATFGEDNSFYGYIGTFDNIFEYGDQGEAIEELREKKRRELIISALGGENIENFTGTQPAFYLRNKSPKEFKAENEKSARKLTDAYLEYVLRYNKPKVDYGPLGPPGNRYIPKNPKIEKKDKTQALSTENPLIYNQLKATNILSDIYEKIYALNDDIKNENWYRDIVEKINQNYFDDTKYKDYYLLQDEYGNMPHGYTNAIGKKPEKDEIKHFKDGRNMRNMPIGKFHWRNPTVNENLNKEIFNALKYKKLKLLY